ncbi:hypothetical protein HKX48_003071 [Thoreauomyces humboldtii]|nr:hypothetical protein HKX48_003071 [Thoreauomyces humboldtii]
MKVSRRSFELTALSFLAFFQKNCTAIRIPTSSDTSLNLCSELMHVNSDFAVLNNGLPGPPICNLCDWDLAPGKVTILTMFLLPTNAASPTTKQRDLLTEIRDISTPSALDDFFMTATRDGHTFTADELSSSFAAAMLPTRPSGAMYACAVQGARRLPPGFLRPDVIASGELVRRMYNFTELLPFFDLAAAPADALRMAERLQSKYSRALGGLGADEMTMRDVMGEDGEEEERLQQRIIKVAACLRAGGLYVMDLVLVGSAGGGSWTSAVPCVYVRETMWATSDQRAELEVLAPIAPPPLDMTPSATYHPLTPQQSAMSFLRASAPSLVSESSFVLASSSPTMPAWKKRVVLDPAPRPRGMEPGPEPDVVLGDEESLPFKQCTHPVEHENRTAT